MSTGLSWAAQLQPNGVYCSPACGGRCKLADYNRAQSDARALVATMGAGWRAEVWENLGWHWIAAKGETKYHRGLAEIHPRDDGTYSAWINPTTDGVSQTIVDGTSDPIETLGLALQEARTKALRYSAELDEISA